MRQFPRVFLLAGLLAALATVVSAQPSKGPPNALQGFSQNRGQPVEIDAATLEVRDKDKVATFAGDVHVKQGDTTMRSKSLVVFYEQETEPAAKNNTAEGRAENRRVEVRLMTNVVGAQPAQTPNTAQQ